MSEMKNHWEKIYHTKCDNELDWFQLIPTKSIELIEKYAISKQNRIIDVGAGNSNLTQNLCSKGYKNLTVLDISEEAIERCRAKLQKCKAIKDLIAIDILDFCPRTTFQIWHDRASFHFLTQTIDIKKYVSLASRNIVKSGVLIIGTFSLSAPNKCSKLPVKRYDAPMLEVLFSSNFTMIENVEDLHITPSGSEQYFLWVVFKRN